MKTVLCKECGKPGAVISRPDGPAVKIVEQLEAKSVTDEFCSNCLNKGEYLYEAILERACPNCIEEHIHGHSIKENRNENKISMAALALNSIKKTLQSSYLGEPVKDELFKASIRLQRVINLLEGTVTGNKNKEITYEEISKNKENSEQILSGFRETLPLFLKRRSILFLISKDKVQSWNVYDLKGEAVFEIRAAKGFDFYDILKNTLNEPAPVNVLLCNIEGDERGLVWFHPTPEGKIVWKGGKRVPLEYIHKVFDSGDMLEVAYYKDFKGIEKQWE